VSFDSGNIPQETLDYLASKKSTGIFGRTASSGAPDQNGLGKKPHSRKSLGGRVLKFICFVGCAIALLIVLVLIFVPSNKSPNTEPSAHVATLYQDVVLKAHGDREPDGAIVISGTTNLPNGLKMWVEIESGHLPLGAPKVVASDEAVYVKNGSFQTAPLWLEVPNTTFTKKGWPAGVSVDVRQRPLPQGSNKVHFESFFNNAWQTDAVLAVIGNNEGKNLKGAILKPTDSDVTNSPKTLDYRQTLILPTLSPEGKAINLVRGSVLSVPEKGRSAGDIQANLDLFLASPGMTLGNGWNTRALTSSYYEVSYDFIDGSEGEKQAIWTANLVTGAVKYVNESAKLFSWTPSY
jgi:hypothetical protein